MAASLLFTQCKKEESVSSAGKTVSMTVTAGPGSKTDITDAGAITWSDGDKLYVGCDGKYVGCLTLVGDGGSATGVFSGNVTLPTDTKDGEKSFGFFYLGSETPTGLAEGATSVEVKFDSQTGLREDLGSCHVGYGSATGTVVGDAVTDINVMLVSKVALAHFSFTKDAADYTDALTLSGDNIYSTMTVKFNSTEFDCEGTKGEISLTNTTSSEKYVMLVPTSETTGEQALTFAGENVSGSYTLANGIEANKFYGLTGAIAVTLEAAGPTHEYVDLGLPSGLLWATCNLGADSPEKYGDYYQWGGVTSVTSTDINVGWDGCPFTNGTYSSSNKKVFTKYVPTEKTEYWAGSGDPDNKLVLDPEDDAAHENWGGDWRMPTSAEWDELYNNTDCTWTTENGVYGCKFASKKDAAKYIFLPFAGFRYGMSVYAAGSYGVYWLSSLNSSDPSYACNMYFDSSHVYPQPNDYRCTGFSVRPVRAAE